MIYSPLKLIACIDFEIRATKFVRLCLRNSNCNRFCSTCVIIYLTINRQQINNEDKREEKQVVSKMSSKKPKSDEFIVSDTESSTDSDAKSRNVDQKKKVKPQKKKLKDESSCSEESDIDEVKPKKKKEEKEKSSSKKQKMESGDESDIDEVEPKEKEEKKEKSPKKQTEESDTEDDNKSEWQLSKNRKISINKFKGKMLIDIREYYEAGGEMKPGRKGISLTCEQWEILLSVAEKVNDRLK